MVDRLEHGVLANIHEEMEAVDGYRKLAKVARKAKNKPAAKLFSHIAKEEVHHKTELKKLARKLEKAEG